jgi:cytochrome c5
VKLKLKAAFNYQVMSRRCSLIVSLSAGLLVALVACARPTLPAATPADANRASATWPGTTSADLDRGRSIYVARCSGCHQPVQPTAIPATEWPGHIAEMKERAHLDEHEVTLVERYLVTMSTARASAVGH